MFMESGHSYLPNDQDFGIITKALKRCHAVYSPAEYYKLVVNAKSHKPFEVKEMDTFISLAGLESVIINRKKNVEKEQVRWLKMKWMKFTKGSLEMEYKSDFEPGTFHGCRHV